MTSEVEVGVVDDVDGRRLVSDGLHVDDQSSVGTQAVRHLSHRRPREALVSVLGDEAECHPVRVFGRVP